jgi:predicted NBD/HSP70 family sugar kinase
VTNEAIRLTPGASDLVATLLARGPLPRAALSRTTGLTQGAVTKALAPLVAEGYIVELPPVNGGRGGRPPVPLAISPDREHVIGLKLTADAVHGVRTDLRTAVRAEVEMALAGSGVTEGVDALVRAVVSLRSVDGPPLSRIGVAVSGDVDRRGGTVRYSPFLDWHDVPLAAMLGDATGTPVTIENDVKSLACEEQLLGAGAGLRNVAVVTIGTGVGCALVVDGHLVAGSVGIAGELGHVVVDRTGPECRCGSRGCIEAIASTSAVERALAATTDATTVAEGARLAAAGDAAALRCLNDAGDALGIGLATVANLVGPERIVLTGELVDQPVLIAAATDRFRAQTFGAAAHTDLVVRKLPMTRWAVGAAAVAVQEALCLVSHHRSPRATRAPAARRTDENHDTH